MDALTSGTFITDLLMDFESACLTGVAVVQHEALNVLLWLGVIEIALGFFKNFDGDQFKMLTTKFLKIGFFLWLIPNWAGPNGLNLSGAIFTSFEKIGVLAAGQTAAEADPAAIGEKAILIVGTFMESLFTDSMGIGQMLLNVLLLVLVVLCVFFLALQLFLTFVEFYLLSVVTVILLPFGVNKHTSFLSEKAIGAICSLGVKMMVLQFVMCVAVPMVQRWGELGASDDPATILRILLGAAALALLSWQAPALAQGLLSGAPSFSEAAASAGKSAAGSVAAAATGGASKVLSTVGAVQQAAKMGAAKGGGYRGIAKSLGLGAIMQSPYGQARVNMYRAMHNARRVMK